ncbi:MAG TPA: amidohydrolase, partial [Planctomycetota bacterium]|nr:amidohydrolase [Planctomycetota bacterium]
FATGALPPGSILAHGIHLTRDQVRHADANRLWLVQNPRSNRGNRVGYPVALHASGHVALGTDGYASDLREELAALHELAAQFEPCTSTRALRGRLEAGRELVAEHFGELELASDLVELAPAGGRPDPPVVRVVVAGHTVVREGVLLTGDLAEIRTHAGEEAARLWKQMEAL